ncbi:hypothetical protein L210DRAFT_943580 [Boletus edulis BED1]|uniref:Uncharacterized protein n=1 Tax=Boletus edulis BED1 TaxID=1328754 RepID=A0AAD4C135_BOLED|nr:hypothetical protein L210DRAFT_943580 [Boletus edulis BED1]
MSSTSSLSLTDFTASELPTTKWMRLIRPKMRLRVRAQHREFVSSAVKVDDRGLDGMNFLGRVQWPWNDDGRFPRPFFVDDEEFEIQIEKRSVLRYKCIRRTQRTSIDQIRTGDHCALSLYDGQLPAEMLEHGIRMGDITFTLRNEQSSGVNSSSSSTYS